MRSAWLSRLLFVAVSVVALGVVMTDAACTRWGKPGPVPPTILPLSEIFVDPATGSDSTGNGSATKPYKTLTKAIAVLTASKELSPSGVTIYLSTGDYDAANGERFPIVVPTGVSISGMHFGSGPHSGVFIDGSGEDTLFEELVHAPPHTQYATFEVAPGVAASVGEIYVGDSKLKLPNSKAAYASLDVLGALSASVSGFGAGIVSSLPSISGVVLPGGSLTCTSCQIQGNDFGIGAISVPAATSSPSSGVPAITLMHSTGDSTIAAKFADILTDGTANINASDEHFEQARFAYTDALHPLVNTSLRGGIDFGGGVANSPGGNVFIGARVSEIEIVRRFEIVSALDDTWNPDQQHANRGGIYTRKYVFGPGTSGKNVTVFKTAHLSSVTVGPAPVPTPTPSSTPTAYPSTTPT